MTLLYRIKITAVLVIALLGLSACNTIEHRSERIPLSPLPAIVKPDTDLLSLSWQQSLGSRQRCQKPGLGLVLATSSDALFVAECDGRVWSLAVDKGTIRWAHHLKIPIMAGPTLAGDDLIVTTKMPSTIAINAKTGKVRWDKPDANEILTPVGYSGAYLFSHALDDTVMARRVTDGHTVWQTQNPPLNLVLRKSARPVIAEDMVLVGFADGKLIAFEQSTGTIRWIQALSTPMGHDEFQRMVDVSATPVVSDHRVFAVNFQGKLNVLSTASGEKLWSYPVSSSSGLAVSQNHVVVSDSQGMVLALDSKTGKNIWTQAGLRGRRLSAPTIVDDYIFVGDEQGQLHVLELSRGTYLTRVKVSATPIEVAPVCMGKRLFVLSQGAVVSAYILGEKNG
ncbi:MAG: (pyrrolo quinoline) WD40-like repeat, enzyme repeat domain protein [Pseudomonadota bacterium]|jgi:outer membrane protein assembly factor BamB